MTKTASHRGAGASFATFHDKAAAGERRNVLFLGGSLTRGANATDPDRSSYRALVSQRLMDAYPRTPFVFHDAAIGGTDSLLAVFRLDRDVLPRRPDLVWLDFTANDGMRDDDVLHLSAYQTLLRRLIDQACVPVMQVMLPVRGDVESPNLDELKRYHAHLELARVHGTGVADAVAWVREEVAQGRAKLGDLWGPDDPVHPVDAGYRLYARAAWAGFEQAVSQRRLCRVPSVPRYPRWFDEHVRFHLCRAQPAVEGWSVGAPSRVSAYPDMLMSRWLDELAIAHHNDQRPPACLSLRIRGRFALLLGEGTRNSGRFAVRINGRPVGEEDRADGFDAGRLARHAGGNVHFVQVIATDLPPHGVHHLEIQPLLESGQQLRLESVCVAGPGAAVLGTGNVGDAASSVRQLAADGGSGREPGQSKAWSQADLITTSFSSVGSRAAGEPWGTR